MPLMESTISGIDSGGFVWENVFHMTYDASSGATQDHLDAANTLIESTLLTPYANSMNNKATILAISSKKIDAPPSYTLHRSENMPGARAVDPAIGAICAVISWLPSSGTKIGRLFAVGAGIADFVLDIIDPGYETLIQDLADAFTAIDGSTGPFNFQLVIVKKSDLSNNPVAASQVKQYPTTLNKRLRA